ncbi:MAG: acyl-CoA dehydrogenase family protein [Sphingomonas sp.]
MQFDLTDDQRMIRESARRFLRDDACHARLRGIVNADAGYDPRTWEGLAREQGFAGLMIPQAYGGAGLGAIEMALVLEETGGTLAVVPFFETAVLAVQAILSAGSEEQKARLLPDIAAGKVRAAFAGTAGRPALSGGRLTGTARFVTFGHLADLLLVATSDGSLLALPAATPGISVERLPSLDRTRPLAHVGFDLEVPPEAILGPPGGSAAAIARTLEVAAGLLAAEQTGGAQFCLDSTVGHVRERVQFGRPIGAFQAIKHILADMMALVEASRSGAYYAAVAIDRDDGERGEACSVALSWASDCYRHCAGEAIQLHGAIGFTWEHHAHLYFKRARSSSTWLGTAERHRERIAAILLDGADTDGGARHA